MIRFEDVTEELTSAIVGLDNEILLACIISDGKLEEMCVRPGVPIVNDQRASQVIFQTSIIMSIVLQGQDHMGKLEFVYFHMGYVDGLYFALSGGKTLAIMLKPQTITNDIFLKLQAQVRKIVARSTNAKN